MSKKRMNCMQMRESFKPPFAIDLDSFEFMPRDQRLNEIDATAKARMVFAQRHSRFWEMQGTPFVLPTIDKRHLDIFALYKAVDILGDVEAVTKEKKWGQVAKLMGYAMSHGNALKNVYMKWVEPYLRISHKIKCPVTGRSIVHAFSKNIAFSRDERIEILTMLRQGLKPTKIWNRRNDRP
ncbi:hypothetical protein L596_013536 [Steinernema carpocapsae]|uniref:ARID domain-containing protein n=1 Tax=Steinernema carpocapsae TaxID=34508 RepID=A0A4U5P0L0_STECR|nr:hypothetical protein L596_013536 [Steinernema carpocapsae]